jgi:hypothetical protein
MFALYTTRVGKELALASPLESSAFGQPWQPNALVFIIACHSLSAMEFVNASRHGPEEGLVLAI